MVTLRNPVASFKNLLNAIIMNEDYFTNITAHEKGKLNKCVSDTSVDEIGSISFKIKHNDNTSVLVFSKCYKISGRIPAIFKEILMISKITNSTMHEYLESKIDYISKKVDILQTNLP